MLVNGKADEMLYEHHAIATGGLPFSELKQRSLINKRPRAADKGSGFLARDSRRAARSATMNGNGAINVSHFAVIWYRTFREDW
jgi:hypothetical protein